MDFARRALVVVFLLLFLANLFFGMLAIGSGHQIPTETKRYFIVTAMVLIILTFLTHKYMRRKSTD
jgi:protein-S-isoprenylcysteine O-methyltransferase Ste14